MVEQMTNGERQMAVAEPTPIYEIRVAGRLEAAHWQSWFEGMTVIVDEDARETILYGPVYDQAALYGLLSRVRDMALTLRSVRMVEENPPHIKGGWWRGQQASMRGSRWLLVLAYLMLTGGAAAMTVFMTGSAGLNVALALSILFTGLTVLEMVFYRNDGGWAWLWLARLTGLGAAVSMIVYLLIAVVPVALGLAILFLMLGGGLAYLLNIQWPDIQLGRQHTEEPADDPSSRDVGRDVGHDG